MIVPDAYSARVKACKNPATEILIQRGEEINSWLKNGSVTTNSTTGSKLTMVPLGADPLISLFPTFAQIFSDQQIVMSEFKTKQSTTNKIKINNRSLL